jgi:hypothetical protein
MPGCSLVHRYKNLLICKAEAGGLLPGSRAARARRRAARAGTRAWARGLGWTRRAWARGLGWTSRARRTCWARRTGRTRRRCSARGHGSKAWPFATPVGHIFRVLLERRRATVPRRKVGSGVQQIAGDQDLLFGGVGQTFHRLTRRHRWIGMSLDRDDDRHRQSDEHPHNTAITHEHSFIQRPPVRIGLFLASLATSGTTAELLRDRILANAR